MRREGTMRVIVPATPAGPKCSPDISTVCPPSVKAFSAPFPPTPVTSGAANFIAGEVVHAQAWETREDEKRREGKRIWKKRR